MYIHPQAWSLNPSEDKVRAVKIIERDDDAEHGGEWSSATWGNTPRMMDGLESKSLGKPGEYIQCEAPVR